MNTLPHLPSEIVEKIVEFCLDSAARKIQWHFREQNKLEQRFFELLTQEHPDYQEIVTLFKLVGRLHLCEPYTKFNVDYSMNSHMDRFGNFVVPHTDYADQFAKLETLFEQTMGYPYGKYD